MRKLQFCNAGALRIVCAFVALLALSTANVLTVHAADEFDEGDAHYVCLKNGSDYITETVGSHTLYHVEVTSTTATDLTIYNDIGTFYNYRTVSVRRKAFCGNTSLATVKFEDTSSNVASVYQVLGMTLGDSCFANCPNLKAIYMKYLATANDNHNVMIRPEWVRPEGEGIFDGSPNVKVYVDAEYYYDYITDEYWSKYADRIVPTTSMRYHVFAGDGMLLDHFRNEDANYTIIKVNNVYPMNLVGHNDAVIADADGKATIYSNFYLRGSNYPGQVKKVWASTYNGCTNLRGVNFQDCYEHSAFTSINITLGDSAFANCPNLHAFDLMCYDFSSGAWTGLKPSAVKLTNGDRFSLGVFANDSNAYIRVLPELVEEFRSDSVYGWGQYGDRIVGYFDVPSGGTGYKGLVYSDIVPTGTTTALTNDDNDGVRQYLTNMSTQLTCSGLKISEMLVDRSERKVYYKFIGGATSDLAGSEKGVMTIVNDFGAFYNYRTIGISPTAFRGNTDVKEITFQDLPDVYACDSYYPLRMIIPDGAFKGCSNLKALNMVYYVTDGDNHYETLGPENIFIGKDVFEGCDSLFTIRVSPDRYQEFIEDPDWSRYKDHIRVWEFAPTDNSTYWADGAEYAYAATLVNNMPNDKVSRYQYSLLNIPVKAARYAAMFTLSYFTGTAIGGSLGTFFKGGLLAEGLTKSLANITISAYTKAFLISAATTLGSTAVSAMLANSGLDAAGKIFSYLVTATAGAVKAIIAEKIGQAVCDGLMGAATASISTAFSQTIKQTGFQLGDVLKMSSYSELYKLKTDMALGNTKYLQTTTYEDEQLNLIGDDVDYPDAWYKWILSSALNKTKDTYVVNKMYIKSLGNLPNGILKIYNDIGSVYNYRTTAISENAARGNTDLKKIKFYDVYDIFVEPYVPLIMTVPDYAFQNCTNLKQLDMYIYLDYKANARYPLGPNNFCLLGEHVFDGCASDFKIHIAREKLDEFLADSIWCKYKDRFVVDDWTETKAFDDGGVRYGYNLVNNSLIDKSTDNVFNIHVIGPADATKESINITVDPGISYDYHTTYVKERAYYGNKSLKKIHFEDMVEWRPGSNEDATVEIELKDSCFANCSSLEELCLMYHIFDGDDDCRALSPSNITVGSGVFAGCPSTFRILVAEEYYTEFISDPYWSEYAEYIVPYFHKPKQISNLFDKESESYNRKYDGFDLHDYAVPMRLKENSSIEGKENITDLSQYMLYAYRRRSEAKDTDHRTIVPDNQFAGFTNLHTIYFPYTIQTIGANALEGTAVRRLYFGQNIKEIGAYAFKNCSKLIAVELHSDKPEEMTIAQTAFSGVPDNYVIYVPDTLVAEYKQSLPYYASHINGLSKNVTTTGLVTFNSTGAGSLTEHFGLTPVKTTYLPGIYYYALNEDNADGTWRDIDSLKIIGNVGLSDFTLIANMASKEWGSLTYLDLSEANMVYDYTGNVLYYLSPSEVLYSFFRLKRSDETSSDYPFGLSYSISGEKKGFDWGRLKTLLWGKSPYHVFSDVTNHPTKVVFPEDFGGFTDVIWGNTYEKNNYTANLGSVAFLSSNVPTGTFIGQDSDTPDIYVPHSSNASYGMATSYGLKASATNSLFMDDEAFRVFAKKTIFTEKDYNKTLDIGTLFKDNKKVANLDDLLRFVSLQEIKPEAFSGCTSLERIAVPIRVEKIGKGAFDDCTSLASITMLTDTVPTLEGEDTLSVEKTMFASLPGNFRIYVIDDMLEKYLNHPQWTKYRDHIVSYQQTDSLITVVVTQPGTLAKALGMSVQTADHAISSVSGADVSGIRRLKVIGPITDVDIALLHCLAGTTSFSNTATPNAQLRYLDLSDAEIKCPTGSYVKMADNKNAKLEEDNVLPPYAFYNCDKIEKLILPRGVTKVCKYSLSKCDYLNTVIFGENVQTVEGFALEDSPRLVSLAITSKTVPSFASNAFGSTAGVLYNKHNFVENIHSTRSLQRAIASNSLLQQHTYNVKANFDDDAFFRVVAMHCVLDTASAERVNYLDGWFTGNTEVKDARQLRHFTGVNYVGPNLFNGCTALERVVMPKGIKSLGFNAFNNCNNLNYVDMTDCSGLSITDCHRDYGIFNGIPKRALVYLPKGNSRQFDEVNFINNPDVESDDEESTATAAYCEDYYIEDKTTVDVPRAFRAEQAKTTRVFSPEVKSTVFLPYGLSAKNAAALGKFYAYKSYNSSTKEVTFTRVEKTEPNTAYLFLPTGTNIDADDVEVAVSRESDPNEVQFIGTYHNITIGENPWAYGYVGTTGDGFVAGKLVKLSATATVPSMRAYLMMKGISAASLAACFVDDGSVTGIGHITNGELDADAPVDVYSADGRKVRSAVNSSECLAGLPSGIYIVNGKKYLVK